MSQVFGTWSSFPPSSSSLADREREKDRKRRRKKEGDSKREREKEKEESVFFPCSKTVNNVTVIFLSPQFFHSIPRKKERGKRKKSRKKSGRKYGPFRSRTGSDDFLTPFSHTFSSFFLSFFFFVLLSSSLILFNSFPFFQKLKSIFVC